MHKHKSSSYFKLWIVSFVIPFFVARVESQQIPDARLHLPSAESPIYEQVNKAIESLRRGNAADAFASIEPLLSEPSPAPEVLTLAALSLTRDSRGPRALRFAELLSTTPGYRIVGLAVLYDVQSKTFSPTLAINAVATRLSKATSATWTMIAETYAEILTDFAAKSASEVIEQTLPLFAHAAAVSMQEGPEQIVKTHLRLADLYATQNDHPAVVETLRRALDSDPTNRDALIRLASVLIETGDLQAAADELKKILQQSPSYTPALLSLIEIYLNQNRNQDVQRVLENALQDPHFENNPIFALYALRAQSWHLSEILAKKTLEKDDSNLDAHTILVEACLRDKRYQDALQYASEAYTRFPNSAVVCHLALVAAREAARLDLAELYLDRLEKIFASDPQGFKLQTLLTERAILAERRNDISQMEQLFRQVLQLDPENHFAMNYLAYTWAERGINLQEALTLITKALTLDPDNSAYLDTLGWVHYQLGEFPKAYEYISKALETGPPHEEILENLGDAADALGRTEEALNYWRESLRLQPGRPYVQEKIDTVLRGEKLSHPLPYRHPPDPSSPHHPKTKEQQNTNDSPKTTADSPHHPNTQSGQTKLFETNP